MARRAKEDPPQPSAPLWMATFGDMVTQVLAFFILLYSFSTVDIIKFRSMMESVQGAFGMGAGIMPNAVSLQESSSASIPSPGAVEQRASQSQMQQLEQVRTDLQSTLSREGLDEGVEVRMDGDRLLIRFPDLVLFDSGLADLKPEAVVRLDGVAEVIGKIPNRIRVEGHTDNVPIRSGQFPSNWELSGARAASVLHYLQDYHAIDPARMEMAGMSEYGPVASNDTAAGRARNRRVDILVLALAGG